MRAERDGIARAFKAAMQTFLHDLRFAVRLLWKSPGFTSVAIIALALGIGANTAIFSVVNSVLLRPLPYRNADRMAIVWETNKAQGWNRMGASGPNYLDFRDQSKSFEDLALLEQGTGTITGFGEPRQVPALRVTTNFLPVLGVKPTLGRNFAPAEGWDQRVAILSDTLWNQLFSRDPNVLGKKVMADDIPYTVIGIRIRPSCWCHGWTPTWRPAIAPIITSA